MKKKFITLRKYQEIIEPGEKLSYSDKSPFGPITLPCRGGVFIAWHGPEALVSNESTGTAYACRVDSNDLKPLNFDVYSIRPNEDTEVIEIVISPKQKYHWTDDIPNIMKASAPGWVKKRIEEIKNNKE